MKTPDWILLGLCAVNLVFFCVTLSPLNLVAAIATATVTYIRVGSNK